jgi:hypothetical protein
MVTAARTLIIAGVVAAAISVHAEDIYKWVDGQGQVHFGSQPPMGAKAKRMNPSAPAQGAVDPASSWQQQLTRSNMRHLQKQQGEDQAARKQQQDNQRCLAARASVDSLNRGGAVYRLDSQGAREYFSEEERQAAMANANQRVAAYCH